jgi:hypothetical protein
VKGETPLPAAQRILKLLRGENKFGTYVSAWFVHDGYHSEETIDIFRIFWYSRSANRNVEPGSFITTSTAHEWRGSRRRRAMSQIDASTRCRSECVINVPATCRGRNGAQIQPKQYIQAHTILRNLAHKHADNNVLVLGGRRDDVRHVAYSLVFPSSTDKLDVC